VGHLEYHTDEGDQGPCRVERTTRIKIRSNPMGYALARHSWATPSFDCRLGAGAPEGTRRREPTDPSRTLE
jgi:hypothetical protein